MMPPNGYTTVTISEETANKLTEIINQSSTFDSQHEVIEHAVNTTFAEKEIIPTSDLAKILYYELAED